MSIELGGQKYDVALTPAEVHRYHLSGLTVCTWDVVVPAGQTHRVFLQCGWVTISAGYKLTSDEVTVVGSYPWNHIADGPGWVFKFKSTASVDTTHRVCLMGVDLPDNVVQGGAFDPTELNWEGTGGSLEL